MKALVGTFNQEKALVETFSEIVQPVVEPMDRFAALIWALGTSTVAHLVVVAVGLRVLLIVEDGVPRRPVTFLVKLHDALCQVCQK